MKIGVVVFPGSNCDQDMVDAFQAFENTEVVKIWHKTTDLQNADLIILPGGFSYGDYLRSGAIARFSPIMKEIISFANKGGFVVGVCNGFQILCESGLLPGALLHNTNQKFICKNVYIKAESSTAIITQGIKGQVLKIPIAHGEGRFFAHPDQLNELVDHDQILFSYCDADGNVTSDANPNGSLLNIAGVSNKNKNVFGMMPHPERAVSQELGNTDGVAILRNLLVDVVA
jgi:phosphoribosylformylglycinamidine synthase